jgi:hypothetical protein
MLRQRGHYVFVRFRRKGKRLVVDLVETRRVDGKVKSDHVARLGSIALPEPFPTAERVRFWRGLKARWRDLVDRLGNRVSADDRRRALRAIAARIAKPGELEERTLDAEPLKRHVEFWDGQSAQQNAFFEKVAAKHAAFVNLANSARADAQENYVRVLQGAPIAAAAVADGNETMLKYLVIEAGGKPPAPADKAFDRKARGVIRPPKA